MASDRKIKARTGIKIGLKTVSGEKAEKISGFGSLGQQNLIWSIKERSPV